VFTSIQIFDIWERCHQKLTEVESIKFLAKQKILKLSVLPNVHVRLADEEDKRLDVIPAQTLDRSTGDPSLAKVGRLDVESISKSNALV
jgi:hypothetical protein